MNQFNSSAGDDYTPAIHTRKGHSAGMRAHGIWAITALAPLVIADPGRFIHNFHTVFNMGLRLPGGSQNFLERILHQRIISVADWRKVEGFLNNLGGAANKLRGSLERELVGGSVLWADGFHNLVVNEGLDDVLDKYFKGSAYTAAHYVLLTDGTPTVAAGDTMASHVGWAEVTAYTEANRPTFTAGSVSGQSVDNSASKADFSINANGTTIGGAGLTTNNTKGGATGTLYSAGAFSAGDKTLDSGDTLSVQGTFTQADDGV